MRAIPPTLFQYLGFLTNGDLGPYTFFTSHRKRLVVFPKTWPKDPPTYHQTLYRQRWRHAALRWQRLPQSTRDLWRTMSLRANLNVTHYNVFLFYILGNHTQHIVTLQNLTGVDVITPTGDPLPYLVP